MNTSKQEKRGLVEYTERLKQENRTVKLLIWGNVLDSFVKTTKEFKKLNEVSDAEERIKMNKLHLNHGQQWLSWDDQTRENMGN